jgi:O-antigen/teichoic acid export membrane protein
MRAIHVVMALLLIVPILINFYTPLYNYVNPKFEGLPFFYWFQIMMLFIVVIPYLAFTYLAKRLDEEGGSS